MTILIISASAIVMVIVGLLAYFTLEQRKEEKQIEKFLKNLETKENE